MRASTQFNSQVSGSNKASLMQNSRVSSDQPPFVKVNKNVNHLGRFGQAVGSNVGALVSAQSQQSSTNKENKLSVFDQ